jgi:hypothetical protein
MSEQLFYLSAYGAAALVGLLVWWLAAFFLYAVLRAIVITIARDVRDAGSPPKGPRAA